jgi:hypothetical protein
MGLALAAILVLEIDLQEYTKDIYQSKWSSLWHPFRYFTMKFKEEATISVE